MRRRSFLGACLRAGAALPAASLLGAEAVAAPTPARAAWRTGRPLLPDPAHGWRGDSSIAASLRTGSRDFPPELPVPEFARPPGPAAPLPGLAERFADLPRHFLFEYYPWYAASPWRHWSQWGRTPPSDIASNYVPRLGPYDSASRGVVEQHARWIADSGAGGINLSWWGPGSFEDRLVHPLMDVMRDHGLKVAFHLEPYALDHGWRYAEDVDYLLQEYGEKRRWDALLLLENEDGSAGPVFKSFRTILPEEVVDCHGVRQRVADFTPDEVWRRQTDGLRRSLASEFDRLTLLCDSLNFRRTAAGGFDGVAIYDPFVRPEAYAVHAANASAAGLLFSFGVNAGFDGIEPRSLEPGACYSPTPFEPPAGTLDWSRAEDRERAAAAAAERIEESLAATLRTQADPVLANTRRGFLLVYLASFNEWHEGHAFEPMQDAAALPPEQRALGYHNPADGAYRLRTLTAQLRRALEARPEPALAAPRAPGHDGRRMTPAAPAAHS